MGIIQEDGNRTRFRIPDGNHRKRTNRKVVTATSASRRNLLSGGGVSVLLFVLFLFCVHFVVAERGEPGAADVPEAGRRLSRRTTVDTVRLFRRSLIEEDGDFLPRTRSGKFSSSARGKLAALTTMLGRPFGADNNSGGKPS